MRDRGDEIDALLRTLDHAAPQVRVEDIIARAQARPRRRPAALVAAGILLAAGVAAAAVVPSTPLHRAVLHAVALVAGSTRGSTPQPLAHAAQGTTVAMVPRARLTVRFLAPRPGVRLRIRFAPVAQLSLVPEGGDADFSVGRDAIVVSRPTAPSFVLTVPSALNELRVERDGTPVFEKRGDTIRTSAPRDAAGDYLLDLDAAAP
ncbi:MAG TPA: hypothetical protein VHM30_12820 [Gemmatimonadaceae bacterium]|nr:hypothetical protein [Gemmatimonadaceae bacterium]